MPFIQGIGKETSVPANSDTLTFASNVTAGSLIQVKCRIGTTGVTVTLTDSLGNTYTSDQINTDDAVNGFSLHCGFALNSAAGACTVTATVSSSATFRWVIEEYSGIATVGAFDKSAVATGSSTTPSSGNTAATTQADELLSGACAITVGGATTFTAGSGYSNLVVAPAAPSSKAAGEGQIVSATGAYSAGFTLALSGAWICAIMTFKAATAATSGGPILDGRTLRGLTFGRVLGAPIFGPMAWKWEAERLHRRNEHLRRAA